MNSILVTEDNAEMRILIEDALGEFNLTFANDLKQTRDVLAANHFDLLILDLILPDGNGLELLSELRAIPVIVLTGKSETSVKVEAFSIGADDYVVKPFDPLELKARVQAKIKKASRFAADDVRVGDLQIDIPKQKVNGIDLTSLELRLLLTISRAPEKVFTRESLLREVWGAGLSVTDRTVDTHIGHLRKKIAGTRSKIDTVVGLGYRFLP